MSEPRNLPGKKKAFPEVSGKSLEAELENMALDELIPILEGYYKKGLQELVQNVADACGLIIGNDGKIRKAK